MGKYLRGPMLGAVSFVLLVLNTIFWSVPFYALVAVKVLMPTRGLRNRVLMGLIWVAQTWSHCNDVLIALLHDVDWDVEGLEQLERERNYMVTCNHQSWVDIVVIMRFLNGRIPFIRFFLKRELFWVPILGPVWWALEYPFMKRYSREYLKRHPEMRGKDLETTRKACERYQHFSVSLLNFFEGTRFTPEKHRKQDSPYRHLLRPKAGGLAFTLNAMNGKLRTLLDVTLVYPGGRPGLWDFLAGRVSRVVMRVQSIPLPQWLLQGDYMNDPEFRAQVQAWVSDLWQHKDEKMEALLRES